LRAAFFDLVLLIQYVALHVKVQPIVDFDRPAVTQWGDQCLFNPGDFMASRIFDR